MRVENNAKFFVTTSGIAEARQNVAPTRGNHPSGTPDSNSRASTILFAHQPVDHPSSVPLTVDGNGNRVLHEAFLRANQIGRRRGRVAEFDCLQTRRVSHYQPHRPIKPTANTARRGNECGRRQCRARGDQFSNDLSPPVACDLRNHVYGSNNHRHAGPAACENPRQRVTRWTMREPQIQHTHSGRNRGRALLINPASPSSGKHYKRRRVDREYEVHNCPSQLWCPMSRAPIEVCTVALPAVSATAIIEYATVANPRRPISRFVLRHSKTEPAPVKETRPSGHEQVTISIPWPARITPSRAFETLPVRNAPKASTPIRARTSNKRETARHLADLTDVWVTSCDRRTVDCARGFFFPPPPEQKPQNQTVTGAKNPPRPACICRRNCGQTKFRIKQQETRTDLCQNQISPRSQLVRRWYRVVGVRRTKTSRGIPGQAAVEGSNVAGGSGSPWKFSPVNLGQRGLPCRLEITPSAIGARRELTRIKVDCVDS